MLWIFGGGLRTEIVIGMNLFAVFKTLQTTCTRLVNNAMFVLVVVLFVEVP